MHGIDLICFILISKKEKQGQNMSCSGVVNWLNVKPVNKRLVKGGK